MKRIEERRGFFGYFILIPPKNFLLTYFVSFMYFMISCFLVKILQVPNPVNPVQNSGNLENLVIP